MSQRFSRQELFELRNSISLRSVVESLLNLPSKYSDGVYRFLCPKCGEFKAALNPITNLGRCFRCQTNFNTIELVMEEQAVNFVQAVRTLQQFRFQNENRKRAKPVSGCQDGSLSLGDILRLAWQNQDS
jgi:DNA primase